MRILLAIGLAFITVFNVMAADSSPYKEGVQYEVLRQQASSEPQVVEYFSLYCPHCFEYEKVLKKIKAEIPEGTKLIRRHVDFLPNRRPEMGRLMSRAYATAEVLDVAEKVVPQIFKYNFVEHSIISSKEDVRNVFIVSGVSGDEFDKAFNSFAVNSKVAAMRDAYKRDEVNSTPTIVINDKYKVRPQGLAESDDFVGDYIKLINYLLKKH